MFISCKCTLSSVLCAFPPAIFCYGIPGVFFKARNVPQYTGLRLKNTTPTDVAERMDLLPQHFPLALSLHVYIPLQQSVCTNVDSDKNVITLTSDKRFEQVSYMPQKADAEYNTRQNVAASSPVIPTTHWTSSSDLTSLRTFRAGVLVLCLLSDEAKLLP
jgi:hypothetical protein